MPFKGKMKNIKFVPSTEKARAIFDPPVPAKRKMPEWFKKMPTKIFENNSVKNPNGITNLTIKACPAVVDMMTVGYTLMLDADVVFVDRNQYNYRVIWDVSWDVISDHLEEQVPKELIPEGFEKSPLKWQRSEGWAIQTPPGYSLLYFHPFYRNDLPFITLPGIVDSDVYDTPINLPFLIKENFYGTIEKGTPIAQIVPVKREVWNHSISKNILENYEHRLDLVKSVMYKSYKKRWWQKKTYK